jgi:hypothetical protein
MAAGWFMCGLSSLAATCQYHHASMQSHVPPKPILLCNSMTASGSYTCHVARCPSGRKLPDCLLQAWLLPGSFLFEHLGVSLFCVGTKSAVDDDLML